MTTHLADMLVNFQTLDASFKEKVRKMFEQLPQYLDEIQNGVAVKDIKTNILNEFGDIANYFDSFETKFKDLNSKFHSSTQNLGRIAGELQEGVMKIRMVPISQIFDRFPRVVRDLQRDLGKKVTLQIEGEEHDLTDQCAVRFKRGHIVVRSFRRACLFLMLDLFGRES